MHKEMINNVSGGMMLFVAGVSKFGTSLNEDNSVIGVGLCGGAVEAGDYYYYSKINYIYIYMELKTPDTFHTPDNTIYIFICTAAVICVLTNTHNKKNVFASFLKRAAE